MSQSSSVRVAVRVRPLTEQEKTQHHHQQGIVRFVPDQPQITIGNEQRSFTFDYAYSPTAEQQTVYSTSVMPLLHKFLDGYNSTILAYGQTGSGKTYSMGIGIDSAYNTVSTGGGIVPRFIDSLFEQIEARKSCSETYGAQVFVSFLELYNEDLVDLLNPVKGMNLMIREDAQGNICWFGVREEPVSNPQELLGLLHKGSIARTTASTDMNRTSSRSHAIFSVILKQQMDDGRRLCSKFHFVDLAGSERLKRTNAVGDRAKEGISINTGLLALGNVISALGDESRKASHIPYRDSKLTRLLQDSLGGNSQTLMLACVSPAEANYTETLNTLKYANRARNIRNRVTVNQEAAADASMTERLKAQIVRLKEELRGNDDFLHAVNDEMDNLKAEVEDLNRTIAHMTEDLARTQYERDMLRDGTPDNLIAEYGKTIERLRTELAMTSRAHQQQQAAAVASLPSPAHTPTHDMVDDTKLNMSPPLPPPATTDTKPTATLKKRHSYRFGSKRSSMRTSRKSGGSGASNRRSLQGGVTPPMPRTRNLDHFKKTLMEERRFLQEQDAINNFADAFNPAKGRDSVVMQKLRGCVDAKQQLIRMLEQHQAQTQAQHQRELAEQRSQYEARLKKLGNEVTSWKRKHAQAISSAEMARNKSNSVIMGFKTKLEKATQEKKKLTKRLKQESDRMRERTSHYERELKRAKRAETQAINARKRTERDAMQHKQAAKRAAEEVGQLSSQMKQVALMLKKSLAQKRIDRQVLTKAMACASVRGYVVRQSLGRFKSAPLQQRVYQKKRLIQRAIAVHASKSNAAVDELHAREQRLLDEQRELLAERELVLAEGDDAYMDDRITAITLELDLIRLQLANIEQHHSKDADDPELDSPELAYQVALSIIRSLEPDEARVVAEALMEQVLELRQLQTSQVMSRCADAVVLKLHQAVIDMRHSPSDHVLLKAIQSTPVNAIQQGPIVPISVT
ncbi:kinesin family member 21 [Lichtheimia corymbifera JMRC:FSU:9682]|uniref:Kinesin-like protein n=1 Tax=Lichtheimia corymbifera JMRC:FSU:9682 TaxID=1263082 RepID=A0A068SEU4_9FUNG|nr:kinesin family member 21 [Lichtheimia corymbifera JMRC:FSU:9682]